ncbi:MAG: hypothetical protein HQL38_16125 [Alphaproteobacteria bacterium]|nr:hypothetical protein [Alphaproteobacteria bacterium]
MDDAALNVAGGVNRLSGGLNALKMTQDQEKATIALLDKSTDTVKQQQSAEVNTGLTGQAGDPNAPRGSNLDIRV